MMPFCILDQGREGVMPSVPDSSMGLDDLPSLEPLHYAHSGTCHTLSNGF